MREDSFLQRTKPVENDVHGHRTIRSQLVLGILERNSSGTFEVNSPPTRQGVIDGVHGDGHGCRAERHFAAPSITRPSTLSSTRRTLSTVGTGELTTTDSAVKIDVYASTQRLYILLNDKPYSCTILSSVAEDGVTHAAPTGPVSVTWGDVLYHSGADYNRGGADLTGNSYLFHRTHMHLTTRRHFDNIGFKSNSPHPDWDEVKFPCANAL